MGANLWLTATPREYTPWTKSTTHTRVLSHTQARASKGNTQVCCTCRGLRTARKRGDVHSYPRRVIKARALFQGHRVPLAKSCCFSAPLPAWKSLGMSTRYLGRTVVGAGQMSLNDKKSDALPKGWGRGEEGRSVSHPPPPTRTPSFGCPAAQPLQGTPHSIFTHCPTKASGGMRIDPPAGRRQHLQKPWGCQQRGLPPPPPVGTVTPQGTNPNSFCFNYLPRETLNYPLSQFSNRSL